MWGSKRVRSLVLGAALAITAAPALAQDAPAAGAKQQFYAGLAVQFVAVDFNTTLTSDSGTAQSDGFNTSPFGFNVRGGWYLRPWLLIELQVATGVADDRVDAGGQRIATAELDEYLAVQVKPELRLGDYQRFTSLDGLVLAGILGWNRMEIPVEDGSGNNFDIDESGTTYGFAVRFDSEQASVFSSIRTISTRVTSRPTDINWAYG